MYGSVQIVLFYGKKISCKVHVHGVILTAQMLHNISPDIYM